MKMKTILRYLYLGVAWGCVFFVITCLIGYQIAGEEYLEPIMQDFSKQAVGAMLAGIFCGSTSIVYTMERLPVYVKILIHFGVGLGGYFLVAYMCGWIPVQSAVHMAGFFAIGIAVFTFIWLGFYLYNRWEAEKMNRRIKELDREQEMLSK